MLSRLFAAALLVPTLAAPAASSHAALRAAAPAVWNIDPVHSGVSFQIRHFVTKVRGRFKDFKGTIAADPEAWQSGSVDVEIATSSISTDNDRRDTHLKSNDFFAADSFPTITFKSARIDRTGDDAKIYGSLTIRGVTKLVVLDGHFSGIMKSTQGDRVGFEATTTVNRLDYGVKWNRAVEGGGAMLGDEVKIEINVEAVRAKS
jgi:polyisoprenoid-binding protein YceI